MKRRGSAADAAYTPRVVGMGLAFLGIAAVLFEREAAAWVWLAPAFYCFIWPHLARALANRSHDPARAEKRNLLLDQLSGGVWMAAMAFSMLPSVLLTTMMAMDTVLAGGRRLLLKGVLAQAAGVVVGLLVYGLAWQPQSSMLQVAACLPLLLAHPILIGHIAHRALVKLKDQRSHLARLSTRDPLSDLFNRRHLDECIRGEFLRFQRSGEPASLALIDFDHFKRVNDTLGHPAGDEAIRRFARQLHRNLRATDTPGRYGGEEFVVLLPGTRSREAGAMMRRLQARLLDEPLLEGRTLTISVGIAELGRELSSPEAWSRLADQMLYRAKHLGRNRVVIAGDDEAPPGAPPSANDERVELPIEPYVLAGLQYGDIAAALFDPSDRLAWANDRFRQMYRLPAGAQTFADIMRHCHAQQMGARVQASDIEAWLASADAKRRSKPHRSFVIDTCDGRLYRIEEISMGDGWLLDLALPHWEREASSADVVPLLGAAKAP